MDLTFFITALANSIAQCHSDEELALLAAVFTQLADTLATILIVRDNSSDC